jgi:hypothetical protein
MVTEIFVAGQCLPSHGFKRPLRHGWRLRGARPSPRRVRICLSGQGSALSDPGPHGGTHKRSGRASYGTDLQQGCHISPGVLTGIAEVPVRAPRGHATGKHPGRRQYSRVISHLPYLPRPSPIKGPAWLHPLAIVPTRPSPLLPDVPTGPAGREFLGQRSFRQVALNRNPSRWRKRRLAFDKP